MSTSSRLARHALTPSFEGVLQRKAAAPACRLDSSPSLLSEHRNTAMIGGFKTASVLAWREVLYPRSRPELDTRSKLLCAILPPYDRRTICGDSSAVKIWCAPNPRRQSAITRPMSRARWPMTMIICWPRLPLRSWRSDAGRTQPLAPPSIPAGFTIGGENGRRIITKQQKPEGV